MSLCVACHAVWRPVAILLSLVVWLWLLVGHAWTEQPASDAVLSDGYRLDADLGLKQYCGDCHLGSEAAGNFDLSRLPRLDSSEHVDTTGWEKIIKRIQSRQMPPVDASRPSETEYQRMFAILDEALAAHAMEYPRPGRPPALRRLTRTEYRFAVRDLFGIDFDVAQWLPEDQSSHGFDNITVSGLSPTLVNRYLTAAQQISRHVVARVQRVPNGLNVRVPADQTQEDHVVGLPFGTRGGVLFKQHFSVAGKYEFQIKLARDRDEMVEGLTQSHDIHLLVDGELKHRFTVDPPKIKNDYTLVDANLVARIEIPAGLHEIGVTFPDRSNSLLEIKRQPFDASFNRHRHPRSSPAIFEVSLVGPFEPVAPVSLQSSSWLFGDQFDRHAIDKPKEQSDAPKQAAEVLSRLMRLAYRRPIDQPDFEQPLKFFHQAYQQDQDFGAGIEAAVTAVLVNPHFLFRIEKEADAGHNLQPAAPISDLELASRLSFFLWSSLPDDELLTCAETGVLRDRAVLKKQVERMLRDSRASALTTNFATQWLYLNNLDSIRPDMRLFPDFDHNLREAFKQETLLAFAAIVREDRNVVDLLSSKTTYLNERLAKHYGVDGVLGSHFREVHLKPASQRGGLLRHGSILTVTSYATRTSPTIRGNWILENILGTPPPPPSTECARFEGESRFSS